MIRLEVDDPTAYQNLESVFLELHGERIPFFIETLELRSPGKALVRFKDITAPEDALPFQGLEMYLPADALPRLKGKRFYYHEIRGFRVIDAKYGEVGVLKDILEYPHQALFQIMDNDKEILVPVVDEIILQVNRKKKILELNVPEGLIELYRG